jgi:ATP-dependent helicase/nuclease subunit A
MREWSTQQRAAIEAPVTNLLVSAAAGSGKTAVLVERIARLIAQGADIGKMLVVTFTNAAVAEMRERIVLRLTQLAEKAGEKDKKRLHLQAADAERADISTIHAFCLNVLRRHFQAVGLDPAFRAGGDAEVRVLKAETLDALFDAKYQERDPDFFLLLEAFGGRDDEGLKDCVCALHEKLCALPDPAGFRRMALENYAGAGMERAARVLLKEAADSLRGHTARLNEAARLCGEAFPATRDYMLASAGLLGRLAAAAEDSMEAFTAAAQSFCWPGDLPREKGEPRARRERAVALREKVKKDVNALLSKELFTGDAARLAGDLPLAGVQLAALFALTDAYDAAYAERKRGRGVIDYADMERLAHRVLQDEAAAGEYRARYDLVFMDEYQDTSFLQEAIIARVCRGDNLFTVGDVKQSIYRFRMAQPELFMRRYEAYADGAGGTRIDLARNFRSTPAVVDTVNAVFEQIMTRGVGGVDYGPDERLTAHREDEGRCELIVLERGVEAPAEEEAEDALEDLTALEREARLVAMRLLKLRAEGKYAWRDMVVLLRSARNSALSYAQAFFRAGIPSFADAAESHIETVEGEIFTNLLRLIDNPMQDIPLLSVLFGPVCGLSAEALLSVRDRFPDPPFYEAARLYAEEERGPTADTLRAFFEKLERWSFLACVRTVHELIETLFAETGLPDTVAALHGGAIRRKNLEQFLSRAQDFAGTGQGLSGFIRFLDHVRTSGDRGDTARALGENDDVVRIMTVHKSKGLEFPVVVLADMGRRFNRSQNSDRVLFDGRAGVGIKTYDPVLRTRRENIIRAAIRDGQEKEDLSEQLRILYVGMTRARDVLIMTGTTSTLEKRVESLGLPGEAGVRAARCLLDLVLCALHRRGALPGVRTLAGGEFSVPVGEASALLVRGVQAGDLTPPGEREASRWQAFWEDPPGPDALERAREAMAFYRLDEAPQIPAKLPVTRLHAAKEAGGLSGGPAVRVRRGAAPPSLAAEQGTAMHAALQHINLRALRGAGDVREQVESMTALGLLSPEQAEMVDVQALWAFADGPLGRRMAASEEVRREWPFTLRIDADEVVPGAPEGRALLVQGVMDACFLEDGAWVLLDHKTDRVAGRDLKEAAGEHAAQLAFYARALEALTGRPVKERWVVLLRAGEAVRLV